MTLNFGQWLWLIATAALFLLILADILGFVEISPIYWLRCSIGLTVIGCRVMPMREVEAAWRRQDER